VNSGTALGKAWWKLQYLPQWHSLLVLRPVCSQSRAAGVAAEVI
jgi:hypothetical protein